MSRFGYWQDLSLRTKGLFVIALPATATVMIAAFTYILGESATRVEQDMSRSWRTIQSLQQLKADEAEVSAHVRAYFITGENPFADKAREAIAAFDMTLQGLADLTANDAVQCRRAADIAALERSRVEHIFNATARFQSGALPPEALREVLRAKEIERLHMESVLNAMQETEKGRLEHRWRELDALHLKLQRAKAICVVFGVAGGVVISLLFASGITYRVKKLQQNVARLATGGALEPLPGGGDEIGALSDGLARTAQLLRQKTGVLEDAPYGIARVDASGRYLWFNKAYARMTSLSECHQPPGIVFSVHQDDRVKVTQTLDEARVRGMVEVEVRIPEAFGSIIEAAMTFLASRESDAGYYVFLQDITLRKAAEAEMVRAKDAALASSAARNDFLAKISHDIRTPLNAILGAANLLSKTALTPDQNEYVRMFQRNSARLIALINDFLDFSKIEAGALRIERVPFRIRETVDEAVATFRESAARKGLALVVEIASDTPEWQFGDPLRVQQILVNLISNAVKFTDRGRVVVHVHRTSAGAAEALRFEVSDTGPGIPAAHQEQVFAAFSQLPNQDSATTVGSGLGLTICRELVERMGGAIGLKSQPGQGSTFHFTLPLEAAAPIEAPADPSNSSTSLPVGFAPRILVAEDTEDNRSLLKFYLAGEAASIRFAFDGQQAVDAIRTGEQFDLILMDLDMPGLDGYEATKFIRAWQRWRGEPLTPVVALSAHAMREAEQASLAAGCIAHVAKPVDQATLISIIRRYARPSRMRSSDHREAADGIAALVPGYLASKPRQIEEAREALASKDFDAVRRFGHNLKGTGRGYGFTQIETIGGEIEKASAAGDEGSIAEHLDHLLNFVTQAHLVETGA